MSMKKLVSYYNIFHAAKLIYCTRHQFMLMKKHIAKNKKIYCKI